MPARCRPTFLADEGFNITPNVGDMPTAFMAEWGSGTPIIGFLGEYDALPNLSQTASTAQEQVVKGGPGHGCGHNMLGTAALAAAVALKAWLEENGKPAPSATMAARRRRRAPARSSWPAQVSSTSWTPR